mmetsp:Transcript_5589/g.18732  ORF Transcript_5589/g.18732 Transcript_5589/m.18732 type:complete len:242 (+) Transcript_5589:73-798(+)
MLPHHGNHCSHLSAPGTASGYKTCALRRPPPSQQLPAPLLLYPPPPSTANADRLGISRPRRLADDHSVSMILPFIAFSAAAMSLSAMAASTFLAAFLSHTCFSLMAATSACESRVAVRPSLAALFSSPSAANAGSACMAAIFVGWQCIHLEPHDASASRTANASGEENRCRNAALAERLERARVMVPSSPVTLARLTIELQGVSTSTVPFSKTGCNTSPSTPLQNSAYDIGWASSILPALS